MVFERNLILHVTIYSKVLLLGRLFLGWVVINDLEAGTVSSLLDLRGGHGDFY